MNTRNKKEEKAFIRKQELEKMQEIFDISYVIDKDIKNIFSIHMHAERKISHHQRFLEMATDRLSHPAYFYLMLFFIILWIMANTFGVFLGLFVFDPGPFYWLQSIISINAILVTLMVLCTQNRQGKLSERWRNLNLEISLLMEHKVSKLIELLEELRRDIPDVKKRYDPQAEAMAESIDPESVFLALNKTFEEATEAEVDIEIEVSTEHTEETITRFIAHTECLENFSNSGKMPTHELSSNEAEKDNQKLGDSRSKDG